MYRLTIGALCVSVAFLAFKAKRRRGYMPFWLGVAASLFIVIGKFIFAIQVLFYGGVVLLIIASLWNSWPKKKVTRSAF